jgi:hypothetical protein
MNNAKPLTVAGDIYWAALSTPNNLSQKYQFDLCNLSDAAVAELEKAGIKYKTKENKPEQGRFITVKSSKYVIKAFDAKTNEQLPENIKVGNGTKAKALIKPYPNRAPGAQSPMCAGASNIYITELVVYNPDALEEAL